MNRGASIQLMADISPKMVDERIVECQIQSTEIKIQEFYIQQNYPTKMKAGKGHPQISNEWECTANRSDLDWTIDSKSDMNNQGEIKKLEMVNM